MAALTTSSLPAHSNENARYAFWLHLSGGIKKALYKFRPLDDDIVAPQLWPCICAYEWVHGLYAFPASCLPWTGNCFAHISVSATPHFNGLNSHYFYLHSLLFTSGQLSGPIQKSAYFGNSCLMTKEVCEFTIKSSFILWLFPEPVNLSNYLLLAINILIFQCPKM